MSSNKGGFRDKFYADIAPIVTGLGAAVVILGALFKIMHYPGAGVMLIVGLGTEAALFVMFAFAPKDPHVPAIEEWARVYPQLLDEDAYDYDDEEGDVPATADNVAGSLNEMMANANITGDTISKLGTGLNSLSDNAAKLGDISKAVSATSDYTKNVETASKSLNEMSKSYQTTAEAMKGMANAATDAQEYHNQVQAITKNLGSLNAVYEMELQDANNHLKAMNKFYSNLSSAMENMADASKDTDQFKSELAKLSTNITQLNNVYGNMLAAMKG